MRHGICLSPAGQHGDARTLGEFAKLAEASGWDGVFLEDYVIFQGKLGTPTYDPWIALAAMALKTEHIRLGTAVTPLARRRPWKVALESVTLDHLSDGRLILGVGLGEHNDASFVRFGEMADDKQRAGILDEALEVLAGLWTGQPFSYDGKHFQIDGVPFSPTPVQKPRIPIWVGGGWPLKGPTRRALRWDGSFMYMHDYGGPWRDWTPDDVRSLKVLVDEDRSASDPFDIVVGGRPRDDDWEKDRALIGSLAEAGATWYVEYEPPNELEVIRERIERGPLRIS